MLESGVTNCQQHVGLQKLSALAGTLHSSLGPNKRYKFIQDETSGESALACSCFRIIQNLEPSCAVGQLVYETIQAQQKFYHTGSGCLLFLAGAWSRAALDCLQRGISVTHIVSAMSEGMDICMDVCRRSAVSVEDLTVTLSDRLTSATHSLGQPSEKPFTGASQLSSSLPGKTEFDHKTLNCSGRRKVKLSRHFCENKFDIDSTGQQSQLPENPDFTHIAKALSHGCDDSMKLVVEAVQMLPKQNAQDSHHPMFDITKIVTCVLPGLPEEHACVVQGCVVLLSDEQAAVAHLLKEQHLKVALINGDLSQNYRHLGFKKPASEQRVRDQLDFSSSSREDEWVERVVKLLMNLEVNLILITGLASESLIQSCCRHHILVVEKLNSSVLRTFAHSVGAVPVTYASQLNKHCVGGSVQVAIWRDLSSYERKSITAVNISTSGNTGPVTVILTSCIHGKLQALEDQFWACACRLHHALKDKALLPGAGGTEMVCIHHLQKRAEHHRQRGSDPGQQTKTGTASNLYRGVVLHLMADGFLDYISTVMANTGWLTKVKARTVVSQQLQKFTTYQDISATFSRLVLEGEEESSAVFSAVKPDKTVPVEVYDNLSVKQEAWRKALDLVLLVLQTDAEIITGVGQKNEESLMLL